MNQLTNMEKSVAKVARTCLRCVQSQDVCEHPVSCSGLRTSREHQVLRTWLIAEGS